MTSCTRFPGTSSSAAVAFNHLGGLERAEVSARVVLFLLLSWSMPVWSTKWALYGGTGTGPVTTVTEWASAMVARHPEELEVSVWLSSGSHAQKALVGNVDCASKYRGHPTLCSTPPALNRTDFGAGGVTFSSSWYSTYSNLDIQQLPSLAGPVVIVYSKDITGNLGSTSDLNFNLSMQVVGAIYGGNITYWDDPSVQALNPSLTLPHERITVIARSDKSSLNDAMTSSISYANPWWTQVPGYGSQAVGKKPKWPHSGYTDSNDPYYMLQSGQEGIIVNALRRPFSIAYVDFTQIRRFGEFLGMAQVISSFDGQPVAPSAATVRNAIDAYSADFSSSGSRMALSALNPQMHQAYPITRFTYWYITKSAASNGDCYRTWLLKELILYSYTTPAEDIADRNGWVVPPTSVVDSVRQQLVQMRCVDSESRSEMSVMDYTPPRYRRCQPGQYIAARAGGAGIHSHLGCRNCPAGTYQPQSNESGIFQCAPAPAGAFVPLPGQSTFQTCGKGTYSGTQGSSTCSPCPTGTFSPSTGFSQCAECPAGRSTSGQEGAVVCDPCERGKYSDAARSGTCQQCPAGMTTREVGAASVSQCACPEGFHMDASRTCVPCGDREGIVCPGFGDPAQAAAGYMILQAGVQPGPLPDAYYCMTRSFCPGGGMQSCAGGRVGVGCAQCPEGHAWDGRNRRCEACAREGWFWLLFWFFSVVVISLLWMFIEVMAKQRMVGDRYIIRLAIAGSTTSLVSVAQCIGLISLLTVPWPDSLLGFVSGSSFFLLDVVDTLKLSCYINSPSSKYAVGAMTVPVSLATMIAAQSLRTCVYKVKFACPDFLNVVGALLFVSLTPLMTSAVAPMMCYSHPDPTDLKSLIKYPTVICGTDEHMGMLALGLVLFLLGIAVLSVLAVVTWKAPGLACAPENSMNFLRATRFLLLPYREDRWYAGALLAPRGLLVALVPVMLADNLHGQVVLFFCLLAICIALLARIWPWRLPFLNSLNLGVMMLLIIAMSLVAVAFVPEVPPSSKQDIFARALQAILVFSGLVVGALVVIIIASVLGRMFGMNTGECLTTVLHFTGRKWHEGGDLAHLILRLAGMPVGELERAIDNLEAYDQQALLASLSAFKQLKRVSGRSEAWGSGGTSSKDSTPRSFSRLPSRCCSEAALFLEEIEIEKSTSNGSSKPDFAGVMPSEAAKAKLQKSPAPPPPPPPPASQSGAAGGEDMVINEVSDRPSFDEELL